MITAGDIFDAVRSDIDDIEKDYATDEWLTPKLQSATDLLMLALSAQPNIVRYKAAVVLASVPIGTTSLKSYFASGKELELLDGVIDMREKLPSDPDQNYQSLTEQQVPPTVAQGPYNGFYTFTGDDILLPGATQALTMRIWGDFVPAKIKDKDSPVLPGAKAVLEFMTASIAARSHGNTQLAIAMDATASRALDQLLNNIMQEQQKQPSRPRGFSEVPALGSVPY